MNHKWFKIGWLCKDRGAECVLVGGALWDAPEAPYNSGHILVPVQAVATRKPLGFLWYSGSSDGHS